ncbi:MAG: FHA domain-containing protein FhaA [Planctomycetes bacterium ADurb.Bin126]|nr:MAG: FHA domain-containing protein FhaA [Planctomycetes bacterium ADurb.Bin126]HOD82353.1 FHA domain-containing protein [Phycisphaerae bacterium]HQL73626.1 FHA domain-containing protein [Phycisphaerae bacterium]
MDVNLVMFKTNGQRKDFPVRSAVTVIGRGENCDLQIPLVSVSRRHCEISAAGDQIKAKDLASSNGTYVNNKRITEVELKAGDRLVIGPVIFTVQVDGQPEEIHPVKTRGQRMAETAEAAQAEVIDLEADVSAEAEGDEEVILGDLEPATEEIDPISALEALAAESQDKPKKKK